MYHLLLITIASQFSQEVRNVSLCSHLYKILILYAQLQDVTVVIHVPN